jgi:hypothetical protein
MTKYDPKLRDDRGALTGDDWTSITDIGRTFNGQPLTLTAYLEIEARHLMVVASFMEEAEVEDVQARDVESWSGGPLLSEGQRLSRVEVVEVTRVRLREQGWCRLRAGERFYIDVGFDYYVYLGSDDPSQTSVELAERLGLFLDRNFPSPHESQD